MKREQGLQIAENMKARGFTLTGWCRAKGISRRTLQEILYSGLGGKRGGEAYNTVLSALEADGFIRIDQSSGHVIIIEEQAAA